MVAETKEVKTARPGVRVRPYHPPRLLVFGAVRVLTASGSAGNQEAGMSTNNPSKRP